MRGEYESKIASLKTELLETSEREQAYRADLFQKKTELGEMEQSLKYSHAKISDMASNLDRFSDQQTSITVSIFRPRKKLFVSSNGRFVKKNKKLF